ncbi:protein-disulfide reductase DsbD domain-containing protein [Brevundimonas sp.]|uniref:protein-disulfide reductase DsbD domain-containing protein n=1 Tax=Brevundimonas sp. TaxID=1871086 RepID=UPI002D4F0050|nr:protein-disulfide reductase DsbD domain-containing protein [Brevundimonas sp.]HYC68637.1 protein-disulfide reductase DsbD domain-containing protein [Brevundimonas sp.]
MTRLLKLFVLLGLLLAPCVAAAQDGRVQRTERIAAELVPMSQWAAPGSTAIVAVRQDIEPGWHTYWRNPGDSGGPTTLTWTLPAGVEAGDIVWPLPQRQRLKTLMNYGYSGEVYLPVPVTIPADARPGSSLPLRVKAQFFVCSAEMCVPDDLILALDLPIRNGAAPLAGRRGAEIRRVVETAPRPAGILARITLQDGVATLTASGGPLAGRDPGPSYFFPFDQGVIAHAATQSGGYGPDGLRLALTPDPDFSAAPKPIRGVLSTALGAFEIAAEGGPPLPGTRGAGDLAPAPEDGPAPVGGSAPTGFIHAALFALLGGLILNLMPCVFPILAMKAAALAASAHDAPRARRDGLAFLAGVLATFLLLAGVLLALRAAGQAAGWGFQLQSPAVIAMLALLMLAVGLNLSGVFHVGAGLQGVGSGPLARLGGTASAFLTGVLAVVVAAPCTAPFMAVALGSALLMPWPMALAVFLMLGLGLALPYVLVSLVPGLLSRLPRPGPWMERLKGLLAFPMYGAALWLAWVFSRQTGAEALGLLMAGGLLLALAAWLFGLAQVDRALGRRGLLLALAAVGALVLAVGGTAMAVRLPVEAGGAPAPAGPGPVSAPWSSEAVQAALAEGRPVLVNFTADWCVTCKINEAGALTSARTRRALQTANVVYLVGDWTRRDDAITAELRRHGRSGVPLYLLYSPGEAEPRILPQLLTEGVVVEALARSGPRTGRPAAAAR